MNRLSVPLSTISAAWLVAFLCVSASAEGPLAPEKGVFLVAKNDIESGPFHHAVVLLLAHGEEGTVGLIVNRETEIPLAKALPELEKPASHELYFGGPVDLSGLMYLFRASGPSEDADHVMGDVYYSGERKLLQELLDAETTREDLHLFIGHAGWAPGQLDGELVRGSWDVVRADAFTVFGKDPATMWHELSKDSRVIARSLPPALSPSRNARAEAP